MLQVSAGAQSASLRVDITPMDGLVLAESAREFVSRLFVWDLAGRLSSGARRPYDTMAPMVSCCS